MAELQWEDPPATATRPGRREGGKFGDQAAALRDNPGKTLKLGEWPSVNAARNFAGQVERGRRKGFEPGGAFEAAVAEKVVWVTYVGTDEEE